MLWTYVQFLAPVTTVDQFPPGINGYDRVKLREFQLQLGYQNAYLVTLKTDNSQPDSFIIERVPRDYVAMD